MPLKTWMDHRPPPKVVRKVVERMIFPRGSNEHSAGGLTLAAEVRELEHRKIPYRIDAVPGVGYRITWAADLEFAE